MRSQPRLAQSPRLPLAALALALLAAALAGCSNISTAGMNAEGVRLFEQARYPEAMQQFQQAIESDPAAADGYYNLAASYHRQASASRQVADFTQAERYYYLCLDRNPNHRECYRGLAVLLVEQNRSEEAFRLLQSWGDRNPLETDPKLELARLSEEFGDREAAKQHLAEALVLSPNNDRVLAALGRIREQEGDLAQAMANYQQSLAANRFQQDVAARVAALQSSAVTAPLAGGNGTRLVTRGVAPAR